MAEQLLTFDGIMEFMREIGRRQQETAEQMRETDRRLQETERLVKETAEQMKETDAQVKRTSQKVGELSGSMGRVIERMVGGQNIIKQFKGLGYIIESHSRNKTFGENLPDNMRGEIDLFLENGEIAIIVEVKTTFKAKDVGYLLNVIEKFRRYTDFKGDKRRFIGAIAGAVVEEEAIKRAHENGAYAIVQSGKTMEILPTPVGFKVREW